MLICATGVLTLVRGPSPASLAMQPTPAPGGGRP